MQDDSCLHRQKNKRGDCMGWLMDYLRGMSLVDYANRQRHRMEHPEAYRIPKVNKDPGTIGGLPRDVWEEERARERRLIEERSAWFKNMLAEVEAKKAKEAADESHKEGD